MWRCARRGWTALRLSISRSAPICRCSIAWPRAVIGCGSGARRAPPAVASTWYRASFRPWLVETTGSARMTHEGEAEMLIDMDRKGISYRLGSYPRVREFATLLARLEATGRWEGSEFCGYTNPVAGEPATRFLLPASPRRVSYFVY